MAPTTPETAANGHAKSEFLKLFWTLAESDVATRTRAAAQLLAYLRDHDDDVQYTLKRLVRGLASSRDAARQGFSAALAALLAEFPESVSLGETLELLNEAMEVSSSMKAMEQREHMFGKLFGLLALHRSGRLTGDDEVMVATIQSLVAMSKWKKWFREACVEAILTVVSDVPPQLFASQLAAELTVLLEGNVSAFNADQVALAVGLQHYIENHKISANNLPPNYPAIQFIRRKHIHTLTEPLKHSTVCFPRVHGAWFGLFGHIMHAGTDSSKLDSELFQETWTVLVENMLLNASTTTHERKGLALKLFELVLPTLPTTVLRSILSPNFVKCLFNNTFSKKTYLHDAARHTLKLFASCAPTEFFDFLQREFIKPMHALVEGVAGDADAEELSAAVKGGGFDAIIAIEEERERQAAVSRKYATIRLWALEHIAEELVNLISSNDSANQKLRAQILKFMVFHAFFEPLAKSTPSKKTKKIKQKVSDAISMSPDPVLSVQVRTAVVKKLFSTVSVKISSDSDAMLSTVFDTVFELLRDHELRSPLGENQRALLINVENHVSALRKRAESVKEATDDAFLVLFMSSALQLLDPDQREHAEGVVADLEKCYVEIQSQKMPVAKSKKSPNKKSPKKMQHNREGESVDAVVVLTDLLLSLLSQDSSAMREIVTHVFRELIPLLNEPSLQTLAAAVAPNLPGDGDEEEVKPEEDGDDEDTDVVECDEDDDEEIVLSSATDIAEALRTDANLAELHREDQTLSAIVGQVKDKAKAKKDAKRHRLQVLHFKLRVVDLLALYATLAHKNPSCKNQVVKLVLPLFESLTAIANSDVEQRVLKERLQSVLLHKFVRGAKEKTTSLESPSERAEIVASLQTVSDLLSKKALDKELGAKVGTAVFIHLIRSVAGGNDLADVKTITALHQIVRSAALDVFTKKHSKFPRSVFDELIARLPKVAIHVLLPTLTEIASAKDNHVAVDDYSRAEVFRLLASLLKPKFVGEPNERNVFEANRSQLLASLVALLQQKREVDEDSKKVETKTKRLKVYLSFALHLVRIWRELGCEESLTELINVAQSLVTSSPVIKGMVTQLANAAGGSGDSKMGSSTGQAAKPTTAKKNTLKKRKRSSSAADDE